MNRLLDGCSNASGSKIQHAIAIKKQRLTVPDLNFRPHNQCQLTRRMCSRRGTDRQLIVGNIHGTDCDRFRTKL